MTTRFLIATTALLTMLGCSETPTRPEPTDPVAAEPAGEIDENAARFPRTFSVDAGTVIAHAPEIEDWQGYEKVTARSAIEVTTAGATAPKFGTLQFTADTDVNLELRLVAVENSVLTELTFPGVDPEESARLENIVKTAFSGKTKQVPLDVVLEYMDPDAEHPILQGFNLEPPPIYVRTTAAILVQLDGEPLLAPIDDTRLRYVINTNWDLFSYDEDSWYLLNEDQWLRTSAEDLSGDWLTVNRLPRDFERLPDDDNWGRVAAQVQPKASVKAKPEVIVTQRPAELIALDGEPTWEPIGETGIAYATNTESNLFQYLNSYYFTVSGRWFTARTLDGPWAGVTPTAMPRPFADIPPDHPKAAVRATLPGTKEAQLAALEADIPRKATVKRDAGKNIAVAFDGEPEFEPIEGTGVFRATNAAFDILRFGDEYYLCYNAVWYLSAQPDGPWRVATEIPAAIYSIPPSSPAYHVTHVHVYESDEDTVQTGYTSGYFGVYVSFGVPWYGTGYYYSPYWYYNSFYGYPYYYPYPYSYGFGGYYNPRTGTYGRTGAVYGPYGGYGRGAIYNPRTGTYGRGAAVWDSNEIAGRGYAYNPRTGTGVATRRYANESGVWGESLITRGDKWLATDSQWTGNTRTTEFAGSGGVTGSTTQTRQGDRVRTEREISQGDRTASSDVIRDEQGNVARRVEGPEGQTGGTVRTSEGDLYAGKDGNVYKRTDDGWQQRDGDSWQPVEGSGERRQQFQERSGDRSMQGFDRRSDRVTTERSRQSFESQNPYGRSNRSRDLDRSYNARQNGYSRYNNRSRSGGRSYQRPRGGGRRR